jgi:hypothetical protein
VKLLKNLTLGMLLYKETAPTLLAMLSESVLGIANVIFLPACVVGGLKGKGSQLGVVISTNILY